MDKNEVIRIYKLANLDLSNQDIDIISDKYNKILDFIDHIFDVDCEDVKMTEMLDNHKAVLREDIEGKSLDRQDALKNAKDTEYGYFRLNWKL
ncbi:MULTISPECIES: Asp-tRNA(Asn)/Glu-tRNA(Gln) amidotransferase subunit GatC [Anaerococcus]|uniref:Aspartyl/glutamyl-tRNA(Asn/Gln) amidotransferase, C subunit n=2 Tax=Anaerococcus vaginalis TaxID=33037 RepID=C7HU67_9FIRM|nr:MULTISPECIES: Asp-tRNA(Asn)/Glu-tRNA(Gln) amidotransferase subunit GatC [Anaerococcus]EEU12847.1 aspartyl/glutamyl-tRNA(Asn/Gln) amidotransferase, C subunit [Anaerococcus vaginalis ATCC 51170]MDD7766147.1 Asp-tRNA(Asn)/Glu-tRNA(Gln) amidotransferase subunit GatC [Anaerococcus vaginalis]MDU2375479.1 Asp-tRNA(Asn)/Glu-tRNA(Gln) amidotransferase subunit GatC [Anaerococcus vaginalis]MDU2648654.1 Asp-tRNA(Asn)/Glu-tRNA(Gln) amidotransferase subunit GatC [Anaerococcus vaginalis]MDU5085477.1 Asp-t